MKRDVFQAIADANRGAILAFLASKKLTLNGVAKTFNIGRPAVSKHMKILSECGVVVTTQHGRERYCEVKFDKFDEVSDWVEEYRYIWEGKLDVLEQFLDKLHSKEKKRIRKRKRRRP